MTEGQSQDGSQVHSGHVQEIEDHSDDSAGTHHRLQIGGQWFSMYGGLPGLEEGDMIAIEYAERGGQDVVTQLIPLPDGLVNDSQDSVDRAVALKAAARTATTAMKEGENILGPETVTTWADQYVNWLQEGSEEDEEVPRE